MLKLQYRTHKGFSLVTVLSLGLISTMMLFAVTASILPLYQKAAQNVPYTQLRMGAESSINAVVADLNNSLSTGQQSTYDVTSYGGTKSTAVVATPPATVTVRNQAPASTDFMYNAVYDFSPAHPIASSSFYTTNPYRIVESIAYSTQNQPPQVLVRSVLRRTVPASTSSTPSSSFLTNTSNSPALPVFKYAAFATQNLRVVGSSITGTNRFDGDISSNGTAAISRGSNIDGSLTVSSATDSRSKSMTVASGSRSSVIQDQLLVNGAYTGFQAGSNVLGRGPGSTTAIPSSISSPSVMPSTPAAPSTAYSLGDLNFQNGGSILFQNGASFPPSAASLSSFASGGQLKLPPGDYIVNSLDTTNSSGISTDSSLSQPVRLYVNSDSSSAVNVTNSGIKNNTNVASNMQLYYGGNNSVSFSGASFNGVVYAPGAPISVSNMNFAGSMVGSQVTLSRSSVKYDSNLGNAAYQTNASRSGYSQASNLTFDPTQYASSSIPYAAITYQEVNNPQP